MLFLPVSPGKSFNIEKLSSDGWKRPQILIFSRKLQSQCEGTAPHGLPRSNRRAVHISECLPAAQVCSGRQAVTGPGNIGDSALSPALRASPRGSRHELSSSSRSKKTVLNRSDLVQLTIFTASSEILNRNWVVLFPCELGSGCSLDLRPWYRCAVGQARILQTLGGGGGLWVSLGFPGEHSDGKTWQRWCFLFPSHAVLVRQPGRLAAAAAGTELFLVVGCGPAEPAIQAQSVWAGVSLPPCPLPASLQGPCLRSYQLRWTRVMDWSSG